MAIFGFRKKAPPSSVYLLMDREYHVLGRGELQGEATDTNLQIKVLDGASGRVAEAEVVQAVPPDSTMPVIMGRVILRKSSLVVLEPMRKLGSAVRKHFRMPVSFESFVYLRTGGRALFRSIDLSCGGMAFYTAAPLDVGDVTLFVQRQGTTVRSIGYSLDVDGYASSDISIMA